MKANRKFLNAKDDEAVSPVIAVILMVAITVVLAATVYVWVSGFGSQSGSAANAISMSSAGPIGASTAPAGTYFKNYTVASASPGMLYSGMSLTLSGSTLTFDATGCTVDLSEYWGACAGTTNRAASAVVTAGDTITIRSATSLSGTSLKVLDPNSNSVMLTLTIG